MKDMDKYWKSVGSLFDSKDNRKVIWIGYAVGLVLVTASIFTLCLRLLRYEEFTFGRMSSLILVLLLGLSLVCFLFYRKKISIKIKPVVSDFCVWWYQYDSSSKSIKKNSI